MSNPLRSIALSGLLLFSLCTASVASVAYADPPERVARLSHTQGEVSYSPTGEDEWFGVVRNRPLIPGDRLWAGRNARAEFQVGSAAVRLGSNTGVEILELNDRIAQVRMTQGTLNLSIRRMYPGQVFEVATPTLAFNIDRPGRYRIDVNQRNAITTIVVWEGAGEAYGENSSFRFQSGDTVRFYDADLRDYEMYGLPREDDFDRYSLDRDQRLARSASLRYVDDDVVGYADLDEYGNWRPDSRYGNVWYPSRVDAGWAPYRDGHWVWQQPWGWTWVDNAPWGFAPSHYGRWVYVSNRWGWIPGPRNVRPVYAPALVAFIGGSGWSVSISLGGGSPIGWFPLGPREVYVPSYQASRDYFTRVNVNNTVINNTTITNVYNNYSSGTINVGQVNYVNRTVAGAVTAVPSTVFVNAQPVRPAAIRLDRKAVSSGEITRVAPIAPSARSVTGASKAAEARPSRETFERRVIVRNAPPPAERPFAMREQQLKKTPGQAPAPEAVKPAPGRDDNATQKVRVIGDQPGAVDARAAGSRRGGGKPDAPAAAPGQLKPLDRSVEPAKESEPVPGDRSRDKDQKSQKEMQKQADEKQQVERSRQSEMQQQAAENQQVERSRQNEMQKQADEKQQAERKRQTDMQQQQAAEKQQVERSRQNEMQKQADEKQQAERKRQTDMQQQQAAEKQQAERSRQNEMQKQADEKQQAERKRQPDMQQQQAAEKQQVERSRQNVMQRQADEKQQAERKRQTDMQQQQAAEKQQVERSRQTEMQRQADEKQQAERKRQTDMQQQQAAEKQQVERGRQTEMQKQADEKQQAERKRQTDMQQQRQAECEREAIRLNQDVSKCRIEVVPQESRDNSNRDKNGK